MLSTLGGNWYASHVAEVMQVSRHMFEAERLRAHENFQDGSVFGMVLPSVQVRGPTLNGNDCPLLDSIIYHVEESALPSLVSKVDGTPSSQLQRKLESAALSVVNAILCAWQERGLDIATSSCGGPLRPGVLAALLHECDDRDEDGLPSIIDEGANIGLDANTPIVDTGLFPRLKRKAKRDALYPKLLWSDSNYKSATDPLLEPFISSTLEEELESGFIKEVERADLNHCCRLGAIGKYTNGLLTGARIIEDHRRSGLNSKLVCPESCALPKGSDLISLLKAVERGEGPLTISQLDVKHAFRHIRLRPQDRPWAGFSFKDHYYMNNVLSFGLLISPYYWCRFSSSINRLTLRLMERSRQLFPSPSSGYLEGSLLYVDDQTLVSSSPKRAVVITSIACVLWGLVGCSLSWSKLSITSTPGYGSCNETRILGYGIRLSQSNSHKFEVYIPDQKLDLMLSQLECLASQTRIPAKDLQSLLGRLQWVGEMFIFLKPHLRSLCAKVSVAQRKGLRFVPIGKNSKLRSDAMSLIALLSGRSREISVCTRLAWCEAQVEPITVVSDASTQALGGFVASGNPVPTVYYFRYDTSDLPQEIGRCMFRTFPSITSRDITALECLAASLALLVAKEKFLTTSDGKWRPLILLSDNSGVVGMMKKTYARKATCAPALELLSREIWQLGIPTGFFHIAGENNHLADWLSRSFCEASHTLDSFTLVSVDHWLNELVTLCPVQRD